MHYKNGELYLYLNKLHDDKKLKEIGAHIEFCSECRARLEKLSGISAMFKSTMQEPPAFNEAAYAAKPAGPVFFRPRWVFAFALAVVLCATFVIKYNFSIIGQKENTVKYIYKVCAPICDINSYTKKYLARTNIININISED